MSAEYDGRVALVTGGGSGIGRACAAAFAQRGARVVVSDINGEGSQETIQQIVGTGGDATPVRADVTSAEDMRALVERTVETYGRLDFAVNNAGVAVAGGPVHEIAEDRWDLCIDINLKGVFLSMKYEAPVMLRQGYGVIVNMASAAGLLGLAGASAYVASKHGVIGLTKSAALEYARSGIRVNAICPAYIYTPMGFPEGHDQQREDELGSQHPVGRMGRAEEVAAMAVYLCSDDAGFITGSAFTIDGGYTAGT